MKSSESCNLVGVTTSTSWARLCECSGVGGLDALELLIQMIMHRFRYVLHNSVIGGHCEVLAIKACKWVRSEDGMKLQ